MDLLSIFGVVIAFSALIGANYLEGGTWATLLNVPAMVIVFGGTMGAAILQTPHKKLIRAFQLFPWIFKPPVFSEKKGIKRVVAWAKLARKSGLLALDYEVAKQSDAYTKRGLALLTDGKDPQFIKDVLDTEISLTEQHDIEAVSFYEAMGGYAPTVGVIGAVLGLIHVLQHLDDPTQLGQGIAVAFVATVYGIALANFVFLPISSKLKACIIARSHYQDMILEGLVAIANGEHPVNINDRLKSYAR